MIKYPWDIKSYGYFIFKKKINFLCELFDFKDYLYIESVSFNFKN